jgi:hypothetical protein
MDPRDSPKQAAAKTDKHGQGVERFQLLSIHVITVGIRRARKIGPSERNSSQGRVIGE